MKLHLMKSAALTLALGVLIAPTQAAAHCNCNSRADCGGGLTTCSGNNIPLCPTGPYRGICSSIFPPQGGSVERGGGEAYQLDTGTPGWNAQQEGGASEARRSRTR